MFDLSVLQKRVSVSKLTAPAPGPEHLAEAFKAALRAADHGKLQPRRFLVIEAEGLERLSQVFVAAAKMADENVSPSVLEKCQKMPFRAPMIIVAITSGKPHPSVPHQEQVISCGAATQNLLNAFFGLDYGAIWRSGDMISNPHVRAQLDIGEGEEIIGFVYVGTPVQEIPPPPEVDVNAFFKPWPAK